MWKLFVFQVLGCKQTKILGTKMKMFYFTGTLMLKTINLRY